MGCRPTFRISREKKHPGNAIKTILTGLQNIFKTYTGRYATAAKKSLRMMVIGAAIEYFFCIFSIFFQTHNIENITMIKISQFFILY